MKAKDIKIGGHYTAKISGKLTTVRVDSVDNGWMTASARRFHVTNLATGRKTVFRSAAKFRRAVEPTVWQLPMEIDREPDAHWMYCRECFRAVVTAYRKRFKG